MSLVKRLPVLALIFLALGAVGFVNKDKLFPPGGGAPKKTGENVTPVRRGAQDRGPVPITAEAAKTADFPVYLEGVGTVQAYNTVTIRAQVSGKLEAVNYREGQDVKKNGVLAVIDPVIYKAQYDQAVAKKAQDEATLENAKRDLVRYEGLAKSDYIAHQQADTQRSLVAQTEAIVRQDQASIDNAEANLNYTTIRAPIDGRTGIRQVDEGNLVSSTDATGIVVITQLKPISVIFTLPQSMIGEINDAQAKGALALNASVAGNTVAEGKLAVVDNAIDQTTGTVKLKGIFPNEDGHLWPGQFVTVRLLLKMLPAVVAIPAAALQQGATGTYVYLVDPETGAKLTNVRVTVEDEKRAIIAEGVKAGDMVATSGFASLQDGSEVMIETPAVAAALGQDNTPRGKTQAAKAAPPVEQPPSAGLEAKTARDGGHGQGEKSSDNSGRVQ